MYAVIKTGGKQYRVAAEDVLTIEKVAGEAGAMVEFTDVLMVAGEGEPKVGTPLLAGARVTAEVVAQGRAPKVIAFKKRRRKNSRRKRGYRDEITVLRITEILADNAQPSIGPRPKKEKVAPVASEDDDEAPKTARKAPARKPAAKSPAKAAAKPRAAAAKKLPRRSPRPTRPKPRARATRSDASTNA